MADTLKRLYNGTLTTGSTTLYTVPSSTQTIVSEIIFCNKTATAATATLTLNGFNLVSAKSIDPNSSIILGMKTVMEATTILSGLSGSSSAIDIYISGIEVS